MATEIEVDLNVSNNIGGSIKQLKELKKELKSTEVGTEAFKNLYNQIDDLEDKIKSAKNVSSDWVDTLEMAGGPVGALGASLNKVKVATQSFGGALKATGIGLIVSLVGGLVAAFNNSEKATKKLQPLLTGLTKIFQGVFNAVEPLFNTLVDLATSALPMVSEAFGVVYSSVTAVFQSLGMLGSSIKKLISGDFSGAWKDAKSSVNDFSKNYDASIERFNKGTKELTKTEKEEGEKRRLARIEASKREDEEIKKLLEHGQQLIDKAKADEEAVYNKRISNVDYLGTHYIGKLEENQKNVTKVLFKNLTDRIDGEIALEKKKSEDLLNQQQSEDDAKLAMKQAYISSAIQLGQGLRQIAGENKELAIAGIILEQSAAVASIAINAQKNFVKDGGVTSPLAWIGLAGSIAAGLSAIAAGAKGISDIQSGKASGSDMSFGNTQMTASYSKSPTFNVVGTSGINQIAQAVGQNQEPVKAYVVSSEISSQQSLDRNKIMSASLG
jgi:hypothetical protein